MNATIFKFGKDKIDVTGYSIHPSIVFSFQPDYTLTEIAETLTLNTNIGVMTFPLIVRIPQRVLATCYQTIPRPVWEAQFYHLCLGSTLFMLVYIAVVAVYEAHRLYNDVIEFDDSFLALRTFCFVSCLSIWLE